MIIIMNIPEEENPNFYESKEFLDFYESDDFLKFMKERYGIKDVYKHLDNPPYEQVKKYGPFVTSEKINNNPFEQKKI